MHIDRHSPAHEGHQRRQPTIHHGPETGIQVSHEPGKPGFPGFDTNRESPFESLTTMTRYERLLGELDREIDHLLRRPPDPWALSRVATLDRIRSWMIDAMEATGDGELAVALCTEAVIASMVRPE